MTLFRFNHYGLTANKFLTDIVRTLSKRNRFSIGHCAKFVSHVQCPTVISHPDKGLKVHRQEIKIVNFADDTSIFSGDISCYEKASSSMINFSKEPGIMS